MVIEDFFNSAVDVLAFALPYVAIPVTLWIIARFKVWWDNFSHSAPEVLVWVIEEAATRGYNVAEQLLKAGVIVPEDRLNQAIETAERYLAGIGYEVELDVLQDAIEDIVFRVRTASE